MKHGFILIGAVLLLLLGACGGGEATAPVVPVASAPTPDIEATVEARVRARLNVAVRGTPIPEPLRPAAVEAIQAFATGHRALTNRWDQFHKEVDAWRNGLVACDPSSVQAALRRFTSLAADIAKDTADLPHLAAVTDLVNELVHAAEAEERAFRALQDTWEPEIEAVYQEVAHQRSFAVASQNELEGALVDTTQQTSPATRDALFSYAVVLRSVNVDWDNFHRLYNQFRADEAELTSAEIVSQLSDLVDFLGIVTTKVRNLPHGDLTAPISDVISQAADDEERALRNLRNAYAKSEPPGTTVPEVPSGEDVQSPNSQELEGATEVEGSSFEIRDAGLFQAFGEQLVESNGMRRQAMAMLAQVLDDASGDEQAAVERFSTAYEALVAASRTFHDEYDDWRRTDGGCDRSKALETLGQFAADFSDLVFEAQALPGTSPLAALKEIFVEAAEREEEAVRDLRNGWHPFDSDVYQELETERRAAARLRRQVALGITDLMSEYELTLVEP